MLEVRLIGTSNLPDAARLCVAGRTPGDRPRGFTREVEMDSSRCKISRLHEQMRKGARAYAAYRSGMLVGYLECHPIEIAPVPLNGADSAVVQCLRVPEEAERAEVEHALVQKAVADFASKRGIAVLSREKEWAPLGFEEAAREASEVTGFERALWWRALAGGDAPTFAPVDRRIPKIPGKVRVDLFTNERCPWDLFVFDLVKGVCERMRDEVVTYETDCTSRREVLRSGVGVGIAVNGEFQPWVRPFKLPDEHTVRRAIENAV